MSRIEYKYLVPLNKVEGLRRQLLPFTVRDKYSDMRKEKHYSVRSIYFDTANLDFYQEKLAGIKRRKKIRIRVYNEIEENALAFLEIKRKNGPAISKQRSKVLYNNLNKLIVSGDLHSYLYKGNGASDINTAQNFFYNVHSMNLIPVIKIIYEREAYFYKFNKHVRITLDKNLRSSLSVLFDTFFEEKNMVYTVPKHVILEVKVLSEMPAWIRDVIARLNFKLLALSKYTMSVDSHSKYERQLQRSIHGLSKFNRFTNYTNGERITK